MEKSDADADGGCICRICQESEPVLSLISDVCCCKGSMRMVHKDCLMHWIQFQASRGVFSFSKPVCEICKSRFHLPFMLLLSLHSLSISPFPSLCFSFPDHGHHPLRLSIQMRMKPAREWRVPRFSRNERVRIYVFLLSYILASFGPSFSPTSTYTLSGSKKKKKQGL